MADYSVPTYIEKAQQQTCPVCKAGPGEPCDFGEQSFPGVHNKRILTSADAEQALREDLEERTAAEAEFPMDVSDAIVIRLMREAFIKGAQWRRNHG